MIHILYRTSKATSPLEIQVEKLSAALKDKGGLLWIDIIDETDEVVSTFLRERFNFHPLSVDDALREAHIPKIDDWGSYLYLVLHGLDSNTSVADGISTHELDIFLGDRYLVTYHKAAIDAIDHTMNLCHRDERIFQNGTAYLLYLLADAMVSDYMTLIDGIDEQLSQIEDEIFADPGPSLLEQIFNWKRGLLTLRRILSPQREVINKLARGDYSVIPANQRVYFRDIYDHLVRLYDIIESMRDLTAGSLDIYVSVYSNRMTEVMKTLTIITTIFIPISFLSGFFGMNFFAPTIPLKAWTGWVAFAITLLIMVLAPMSMYLWMRRRAWM